MLINLANDELDTWRHHFIRFFENKFLPPTYSNCPTCSIDLNNKMNSENNYDPRLDLNEMKDIEFSTMSTLQMESDIYSSQLMDHNSLCYGDRSKTMNKALNEGIYIYFLIRCKVKPIKKTK